MLDREILVRAVLMAIAFIILGITVSAVIVLVITYLGIETFIGVIAFIGLTWIMYCVILNKEKEKG